MVLDRSDTRDVLATFVCASMTSLTIGPLDARKAHAPRGSP